jgi:hypothetical protein
MQTNAKKILSIFSVLLLAGIVLGYGYYRTRDFLNGPVVEITSPQNGQMLSFALIDVRGISKNIAFLNLNGRKIFTDEAGNWHEKLLASPGYNRIEVSAKDRFGRDVTKTLEVVLKE